MIFLSFFCIHLSPTGILFNKEKLSMIQFFSFIFFLHIPFPDWPLVQHRETIHDFKFFIQFFCFYLFFCIYLSSTSFLFNIDKLFFFTFFLTIFLLFFCIYLSPTGLLFNIGKGICKKNKRKIVRKKVKK